MGVLNVIMLHKFYLNIIEVVEVFISILIMQGHFCKISFQEKPENNSPFKHIMLVHIPTIILPPALPPK